MIINIPGTIKKINMMSANKERFRKYSNLLWSLSFLCQSNQLTFKEVSDYLSQIVDNKQLQTLFTTTSKTYMEDLFYNIDKLNKLYYPILTNVKNKPFFVQQYPEKNIDELVSCLEDFFKFLGNDIYNLYARMIKNKLIVEKLNIDKFAASCGYINGEVSCIFLEMNMTNMYKTITLGHEIGHAYDNYLTKTLDYHRNFQLNNEVTSMTFELLFIYFLCQNYSLSSKEQKLLLQNYYTDYLLRMNNAYISNNIFFSLKNPTIDFGLSDNFLNEKGLLEYGILQNNLASKIIQQNNFYANFYAFGIIIASYFFNEFKKNPEIAIKEIKEFSCFSNNLSASEILSCFNKSDLINATISNASKILKKAP